MNDVPTILVKNTISTKQVLLAWALLGITVKRAYKIGVKSGFSQGYASAQVSK